MNEIQELKMELAKLRREFASRALSEIQERVKVSASFSIKMEELEERLKTREVDILSRLKYLGDRFKLLERSIYGTPEAKVEEDDGHPI